MKKIPSLYQRDEATGLKTVKDAVTPGCEWVLQGHGDATVKWDGTACKIEGGKLYKRYDAKKGRTAPPDFEPAQDPDPITGHWPGWVPVDMTPTDQGGKPEDQYHREAFHSPILVNGTPLGDGTYELVGPAVNANPHNMHPHVLIPHGKHPVNAPTEFNALAGFLRSFDGEGIVWHSPDGRMAKIKRRDFGFKWGKGDK